MKKIFRILTAGVLALVAFSSCVREQLAVYDETKVTAPVLGTYNVGEDVITANFTPAKLELGFNEKIVPSHTLAVVSLNGEEKSKSLTTSNDGATITLKTVNLAKALITLGAKEGSTAKVELAVRATLQDVAKDNGRNGYVDSEKHIVIAAFEVVIPEQVGSPYEEYTEKSDWSLIGAMSAYGIDWNGDLNMWATQDGNQHVAAHVILKAGDQVKFRKDQAWTVNMGGSFGTLGEEFAVEQDGSNIEITKDGVYDLFLDLAAGTAIVAEGFDPYPDFTKETAWTVIGALSKLGIDWNGDVAMVSDGTVSVAFSVALAADDEFKFRKDKAWTVNLGGEFGGLDTDFAVSQDGPNIKVGAEGVYDLFVDPTAETAKVTAAAGVKVSTKIVADTPEPEPVKGWNIIGLNGDWDNDILATEKDGVWTAYITAIPEEGKTTTTFKWRKDGDWAENYGGTFVALGEPFEAVAGGGDIAIPAGFFKAELNLSDAEHPTITISNGEVWSLIGEFNEWAGDVDMTLTDGKWVSPVTKLDGKFKIRKNHNWDVSVGGVFVAVGEPFAAGTEDIVVPAGSYVVTYDPTAATILVEEAGWGLVGTINSWGATPDIILKEEGNFLVAKNVTLTADDAIKIRYNQDWTENRGGMSVVGVPVQAVPGGPDIKPGAGTFDVYYRPNSEVIVVAQAGAAFDYWGVVGTINSWGGTPDIVMFQNADGKLESKEIELTAADEIKIRLNEAWDANRGGTFAALGEAFAVENNGANIKLGRDAKVSVVYDAATETITINGEFTGEEPPAPTSMYIIGEAIGGWDWAGDYILEMVAPVNNIWGGDAEGQYYLVTWLPGGKGFKFCSQKAWSGDFAQLTTNTGFTVVDGNCQVEADGIYLIHISLKTSTILIEPAKLYGIGDAFGGWTEGVAANLFAVDGKTLKATATNGFKGSEKDLRIYVDSSLEGKTAWWTRELTVLDGKIVYRTGDELAWPKVGKGQVVTLDFSNYTGSITGEAEAGEEPWGLIGFHSTDMWSTNQPLTAVEGHDGWMVAKNIGSAGSGTDINITFKFRKGTGWDTQLGATVAGPHDLNTIIPLVSNGNDIKIMGEGTYDVYVNIDELKCFVLTAGSAFVIPGGGATTDWKADATDLSTAGTANCYVVSAAGAYKIHAVKGNTTTSVGTVAGAEVVWETYNNTESVTVNSVIAAVDFDADNVYFKTPDTLKPGNALVAAKDANGKIIWSWHIWIPKTAFTAASYDGLFGSNVMSRNLGALEDADEAGASAESCGLLYQWGRKDPFMGVGEMKANSSTAATVSNAFADKSGTQITIEASIQNPTMFAYNAETAASPTYQGLNWTSEDNSSAWGTADAKGVYDPCPAGYRVPAFDAEKPGWVTDGWTLDLTHFFYKKGDAVFPYAGYLDDCNGKVTHGGDRSAVWSATASDENSAKSFDVRSSYALKSQYKARGNSVRCVAE